MARTAPPGTLTPREREVTSLVARGWTNQQIAEELVLMPGTVANHVERARSKLGLASRTELAVWASQHGLAATEDRLLTTLERLLEIEPVDLANSLDQATQALAEVLGADKVDAFVCEAATTTLVARGTSKTPMGRKQHALGLHRLAIANGGRVVEVFLAGSPHLSGRVDRDRGELRGIRRGLGVRSQIGVPFVVAGEARGVLLACSGQPDFFTQRDLRFLRSVARWVGVVAHRAELAQRATAEAVEQGRRTAAEELVTILAHDLRNYLTPIAGRLEIVRRRAERERQEQTLHDAHELLHAVGRLDRLTCDLLDTARLEQGIFSLSLRPIDLVALARATARALASADGAVQVRARADELTVWADPDRVRQVLENLCANALKHSPPGAPIVVEVASEAGDDGPRAVVAVIDQGPGIPAELLPRVFERFTAGPGSTGLGLGLYLAHGIARQHGGALTVDAGPDRGTRFQLTLPAEPPVPSEDGSCRHSESVDQDGHHLPPVSVAPT